MLDKTETSVKSCFFNVCILRPIRPVTMSNIQYYIFTQNFPWQLLHILLAVELN